MSESTRQPLRLAVLISGGGRTLANIADHIEAGALPAQIALVVASKEGVYGLERAKTIGVPTAVVPRKQYNSPAEFSDVVFGHVRDAGADLVCLAGFLWLLVIPPDFAWKVLNVHPALLPGFGGKGMYGHHVHEAVLAAGCKVCGCTIHFADPDYDKGPIVVQRCCDVREDDTPDTLAARVFEQECIAYPQAIRLIAEGRVTVKNGRTHIEGK